MLKKIILTFALLTLGKTLLFSQSATLRGKVLDGELGDPLISASVSIFQAEELITGTVTDIDGIYETKLEVGTYQIIISYVSYTSDTSSITLTAGENSTKETLLYEEGTLLGTVVVEAQVARSSDLGINLKKQNAVNSLDGVSIDLIKRTGDNNVAGALTRITGVSIESGKYVTVRGLGDRYSKVLLNGGEIPALDPNRNAAQLDIFPSNLIDNVIVYKNFTPDLPGSFTGGLVDISTQTHPEDFQLHFSTSFTYNPTANLRDDFLSYDGGTIDWLGIDDGTRDIPEFVRTFDDGFILSGGQDTLFSIPSIGKATTDSVRATIADRVAQSFPAFQTQTKKQSGFNQNYQFSIGNEFNLFGKPVGVVLGASYRRSFQYNEDFRLGRFQLQDTSNVQQIRNILGVLTEEEALWGTIAGLSYKPADRHKFSFTYMHNQSGVNQTRQQAGTDEFDLGTTTDSLLDNTVSFVERSLDAFQLTGKHLFGALEIDWSANLNYSSDQQPDFRVVQYSSLQTPELRLDENMIPVVDENGFPVFDTIRIYNYQPSVHQAPQRYYRDLQEVNQDVKLNLRLPFKVWAGGKANFKFGGAYTYKERDFIEKQYNINVDQGKFNSRDFVFRNTGNLALAFDDKNFGISEVTRLGGRDQYNFLLSYVEASNSTNTYFADQTIWAAYGMFEIPIVERLKFIGGLRYETTDINLQTAPRPDGVFEEGDLEARDVLPASLLIWKVAKNMNFRASYARTLARPSFREFAPYTNFAFIGDFTFTGNPELERTLIDNLDLRYEWFPTSGELISISGFYKNLDQPIEKGFSRFSQTDQDDIFIYNVERGEAYGIELEIRKNFGFITEELQPLQFSSNFTFIESSVQLDSFTLNVAQRFTGSTSRPLFGQPDYTLNLELAFIDNLKSGIQASVSYNIFGQKLSLVGGSNFNVYEQPRALLNASLRKTIGEHFAVRLRARNLLNPAYKQVYRITEDSTEEFLFEEYFLGRSYSLGISFQL